MFLSFRRESRDSLFCEYTSLDPCKIWQVIGRTDGNGFGARAVMISLKLVESCEGSDVRIKALLKGPWCEVPVLARTGASVRKRYKKNKALEVQAIAVGEERRACVRLCVLWQHLCSAEASLSTMWRICDGRRRVHSLCSVGRLPLFNQAHALAFEHVQQRLCTRPCRSQTGKSTLLISQCCAYTSALIRSPSR